MEKYAEAVHELREHIASDVTIFQMDLRNQGLSGRERELRGGAAAGRSDRSRFGYISNWRKWVHDTEDFVTKVVRPTMAKQRQSSGRPLRICAVAHSTGCLITMHVAARHPDWFHSITLSSPFFRLRDHKRILGNLDLLTLPFKFMASAFAVRTFLGQEVVPTKDMVLDGKHKMSHNRARCEWWHDIRTSKNPSGCAAVVMTWHWLNQATLCYAALPSELPRVTCPVAIVPADEEVLVSNEATYELAALIPDCTIVRPGTGCFHEIWIEDEESRLLLRDVCVQNAAGANVGCERWHGNVAAHVVYRSKGSSTLHHDRAHALRSVSLWRLTGVGVVAAWLLRFMLQRMRRFVRQGLLRRARGRKQIFFAVVALAVLTYFRKRLTREKIKPQIDR
jgi:alpha-beta hydrolase superfamily lysophospholipase